MTVPPDPPPPALPGASTWTAGHPTGPTFVQPAAAADAATQPFELAGWGARLAAYGIDQLIRLVLSIAIAVAGFMLLADDPFSVNAGSWTSLAENDVPSFDVGSAESNNLLWLILTVLGLYLFLALFYAPFFMAAWRGATPGKRLVGIRVVRADGADVSLGTAFLREPLVKGLLINVIAGSFIFASLLSYLWPLWDRECRAGHDFIARTRVVKGR